MPATSTSSRTTPLGRRIVNEALPVLRAVETPLNSTVAEVDVAWRGSDCMELLPPGTEAAVRSASSVTTVSRPVRLRVVPSVIFEGADIEAGALGASRSFEVKGD
jgi:hypothetical protein